MILLRFFKALLAILATGQSRDGSSPGRCNTCINRAASATSRAGVALATAALAACGGGHETAVPGKWVECALAGAAGFEPVCTMQRDDRGETRLLVIRHPDGGFRRFAIGVKGQGLVTADGFEAAEVALKNGLVEVQVGADRYRLPVSE